MKAAGVGAGAFATGGTLLGSATAATTSADGNCVQVDLVMGSTVNDLGSTTYSSQDRLVNAQWGDTVNNGPEGETVTRSPKTANCEVDVTSPLSIDFAAEDASVTFDINNCSSGSQDVTLVSYESPCNGNSGGQWDPNNADSQTIFDSVTQTFSGNSSGNTLTVEVPGENLRAYYPLDDAINDGSNAVDAANDNDATINGNVDTGVTGQVNGAYDFSAGSGYLDVPQFTPSGDDSVSVACWVNLDSVGDDEFIFWGDDNPQFELVHDGDGVQFFYDDGTVKGLDSTGVSLSSGTWVHLAGTYDDSTGDWTLYKDGSQVASTTQSIDASFSATESLVGRHPGVGRQVNGRMDEVVFYDRALSGSEVTDLTNDTVPSSGLIAHYELDTDTPVDSSGNGNDASIVGNPDTGATGQFNGAYNLDVGGSGDGYLSYPDLGVTYDGSADWTTAMWINPTGLPAGVKHFIWHPRAKNDINLQIDSSNKEITFSTFDGNPNDLSSGVTPTTGAWTHVAVVSDTSASNQYEIFVDGTSEATGDLPDPGGVSDSNVIGGQPSGDYRYFNGLIDEVRFYDRALSASEIGDLANNGS
jgi:hypothetical protein